MSAGRTPAALDYRGRVSSTPPPGDRRPVVRLFADYSSPWPLWSGAGGGGALDPAELGLSPELSERLRAWVTHWSTHQDAISGWEPPSAREDHQVRGHELFLALVEEVGDRYDVVRPSLGH